MRRKVKQLLAAGMALAVLATNLTPLSFAAEQADAEPAATASVEMYEARASRDWEYTGYSWSSDNATVTFSYKNKKDGSTQSVIVNSTAHKMKSPTCTEDGKTLYTATVHALDAPDGRKHKEEKTVTEPKLDHAYPATPEKIAFVSLDDLGNKPTAQATYQCKRCPETKTETVTDLTYVAVKEATCIEDGEGYWVASAGGKTQESALVHPRKTGRHDFTEKDAAHVTFAFAEDGKTAVATIRCAHCDATTTETVTCTAEVTTPATCTKMGTTTYTAICGTASETTTRQDVALADHDFTKRDAGHVTFDFAENGKTADATIRCAHCDVTTTENVRCIAEVTTPATCTEKGTTTYTAVCGTASGTTTRQDVALTDHDYNSAALDWVGTDFMKGKVTYECSRCEPGDEGHFKYEDVDADVKVVKEPTCLKGGVERHLITASIGGVEVAKKVEDITLPALDHDYNSATLDWVGTDFMKGRVTYECSRCELGDEGHFKYEDVDAVVKVVKEPTCLKEGVERHLITASIGGVEVAKKVEDIKLPALGHDFTKKDADHVTFAFAADGKSAVATIRCDRCDATTTENVTCTAEVTTPATCTEMGTTTYTATCGTASETTTRQDVPALGHSFTDYGYDGNGSCTADGTETAKCDRCDATDTRTASGTAHCALHLVDGAQVCPVCGKVDGSAALNAVSADFDATPDTVGLRLVVRVGSLPSGKRIMTVVFVDGRGCMVPVSGICKVRVSLANVKAQLGESDVADFTHTLTLLNAADGAKTDVGYALENGTLIFDARFDGRACLLQID